VLEGSEGCFHLVALKLWQRVIFAVCSLNVKSFKFLSFKFLAIGDCRR